MWSDGAPGIPLPTVSLDGAILERPETAGAMELAGTQLLLVFTSWGDGVFPIYLDLDAANQPVRVRIQLHTAASNAAMRAVNR